MFKRFSLLIVVFILLIGLNIYAPEVKKVINEKYNNLISEPNEYDENKRTSLDNEALDIDEPEAIFTFNTISEEITERIMGRSYRENDEIKLEDLAYIQVTYWGFDDKEHIGELIVHKKVAEDVVEIFKELYEAKFPIEKIRLIDEYNADDNLSMTDNNTSAFCYREITGSKGKLSNHSYGVAIDINPVQNPYVKGDIVLPESGKEYLDRSNIRKGMIVEGNPCYNAFKRRGWTWGGEWKSLKDYQHFEISIPDSGD